MYKKQCQQHKRTASAVSAYFDAVKTLHEHGKEPSIKVYNVLRTK